MFRLAFRRPCGPGACQYLLSLALFSILGKNVTVKMAEVIMRR